jgi:hypothetical protein
MINNMTNHNKSRVYSRIRFICEDISDWYAILDKPEFHDRDTVEMAPSEIKDNEERLKGLLREMGVI